MTKKMIFLWIAVLLFGIAYGAQYSGYVYDSNGAVVNYLQGVDKGVYSDSTPNPDIYLHLDNSNGEYVALFYIIKTQNKIIGYSITKCTNPDSVLAKVDSNGDAKCVSMIDSPLSSKVKNFDAVFPGRPFFVVSKNSDSSFDLSNSDILLPNENAGGFKLLGYYSFGNDFVHSFDPVSGNISVFIKNIYINMTTNSIKSFDYNTYGAQHIVLGTCEDTRGLNCNDGKEYSASYLKDNTIDLYTGHGGNEITDEHPHIMYLVVDGLPYTLPLGADLKVSHISIPSEIYYGQKLVVRVNVTNYGNVNVTHPFNVSLVIHNLIQSNNPPSDIIYTNETLLNGKEISASNPLQPLQTAEAEFVFYAKNKGNDAFSAADVDLSVTAVADPSNTINETYENNNNLTVNVHYNPIYEVMPYINGVLSWKFNYSEIPYNVTFLVYEFPGDKQASDADVKITESKGVSLFAPLENVTSYFTFHGYKHSTVIIPSNESGNGNICVSVIGRKLVNDAGVISDSLCFEIGSDTAPEKANSPLSDTTKELLSNAFTYVAKAYLSVLKLVISS